MKTKIKNLLSRLNLTEFVLLYIAIKSFIVPTILWSEILGIAIVLVVHYAKRLIPEQKTLVSYEDDFFSEIKRLREEVSQQRRELSDMKLISGLVKNPLKSK